MDSSPQHGLQSHEPFLLKPSPVARVWGGSAVAARFGWDPPAGNAGDAGAAIGEWWLLSFRDDHPSIIDDGPLRDMTLPAAAAAHPELLGRGAPPALLVKVIDARETLSVQVHPDDALGRSLGLGSGKTECWYFLRSSAAARIYRGLRPGTGIDDFFRKIASDPEPDEVLALLRGVEVREGDIVFIPAGTIHAVGGGALILEVQQDSDTTFRIYDWGRPRDLHLDNAREAAQSSGGGEGLEDALEPAQGAVNDHSLRSREDDGVLATCPFFTLSRFRLEEGDELRAPDSHYSFAMILEGTGRIEAGGYARSFLPGDAFFIPAGHPPVLVRTRQAVTTAVAHQGLSEENKK